MASQPPLRIAGVPEAFNDAIDTTDYKTHGVTPAPIFIPHRGGSGAMLQALLDHSVDAAFMLTDCLVTAIENGHPIATPRNLVTSPLNWGVVTNPKRHATLASLQQAIWGVSRLGSGSHVMVRVLASQMGWPPPRDGDGDDEHHGSFRVLGDFASLRTAVRNGDIDAFLWEHFTTLPYMDADTLSIVGNVPTPWGAFCVATRRDSQRIHDVRRAADAFLHAARAYVADEAKCAASVAARHGMTVENATAWVRQVQYAEAGQQVDVQQLRKVRKALLQAGVISRTDDGAVCDDDDYDVSAYFV